MKVIKKENVDGWSRKHICGSCNSELEVEAKDLRHYSYQGDQRDPGYDAFKATCAVCHQEFTVPSNEIPKLIQIEAKGRSRQSPHTSYLDR